jgi:hypothetical protein
MKKILSTSIIVSLLLMVLGCELVREVPEDAVNNSQNGNNPDIPATDTGEVLSPSDHIFDIDLARLREDLSGKTFGEGDEFIITPEEIIDSEFGGSSLANNKMDSIYYLAITRLGTGERAESAVSVNYNWNKNHWVFEGFNQIYYIVLGEGEDKVDRMIRQERVIEYQNSPKVPTDEPEVPADVENLEEEIVDENLGGEEIIDEDIENTELVEDTENIEDTENTEDAEVAEDDEDTADNLEENIL